MYIKRSHLFCEFSYMLLFGNFFSCIIFQVNLVEPVSKYLCKEFPTLSKAEESFNADYFSEDHLVNVTSSPSGTSQADPFSSTPKSSNRFTSDGNLNSLSPLFFSPPHGKMKGERSQMTIVSW